MLEGSVSVLTVVGALTALTTGIVLARDRRRVRPPDCAPKPLKSVPRVETPEAPLDRVAREIAVLLAAEKSGASTSVRPLPAGDAWLALEESRVTQDVRTGLLLLSRAVPEVADYDSNLVLLAKLRAALGAPSFYLVCCKLASLLNAHDPAYRDLAAQLARGQLPWGVFLAGIRDLQLPPQTMHAIPV